MLRPCPLEDPDSVVLCRDRAKPGFRKEAVAPANFDWRAETRTLDFLSAPAGGVILVDRGNPERLPGFLVTSGFFEALSVRPALGRTFVRDDETFGRHHVVILSDALWKRRFDADPAVLGRTVILDGDPHQIVGVMPPRFAFPDGSQIWAPVSFDPKTAPSRTARYMTPLARLKSGTTLEAVQSEMSLVAARLAREYPQANRDHGVRVYTLTQGMLDEGTGRCCRSGRCRR